jgi:hypothetical protein
VHQVALAAALLADLLNRMLHELRIGLRRRECCPQRIDLLPHVGVHEVAALGGVARRADSTEQLEARPERAVVLPRPTRLSLHYVHDGAGEPGFDLAHQLGVVQLPSRRRLRDPQRHEVAEAVAEVRLREVGDVAGVAHRADLLERRADRVGVSRVECRTQPVHRLDRVLVGPLGHHLRHRDVLVAELREPAPDVLHVLLAEIDAERRDPPRQLVHPSEIDRPLRVRRIELIERGRRGTDHRLELGDPVAQLLNLRTLVGSTGGCEREGGHGEERGATHGRMLSCC